ncbi:RecQ helicase TLH3, partial [Metarhizium majus ARSEF 297]
MSSASPAPLLPEPSDKLSRPASPDSPVLAKRALDRSPSDRAGKRAKGRTNKCTWNEARNPYEERGEKARDNSYHEIWYCKHCDSTKKPNSVTTNLSRARKHLRDFHGIRVVEQLERSDLKKQQHGTIMDMFGTQEERQANRDIVEEKHLANAINIPAFEEALARLLAVRNIAHTFIEYPEFHAVILSCNYMARDVLLRSRRAVPKLLEKTFAQHKQGLVEKLHNSLSSMIHFTVDMWTSSEQKAAYQAIVAHFVDAETREVAQALLSLREFKGSHSGELQAKAFLDVVEEYGLSGKIGYFTMDNHDANDTMLDNIAKEIEGLDPVTRRLRCSGHIMNLIVQVFLSRSKAKKIQEDEQEGIDVAYERLCRLSENEGGGRITKAQATEEWRGVSVLGKLHNLCIYSRSSTSIYNDFKAKLGRALPRDNDTRWNSWFRLIDVAIERRAKFMDWIQENHAKIEKDALDHNDWNELRDIHAFLQVFQQISVRQGRENTLDEVLSHMDFLHHHFTQTRNKAFSNPRFYARFHVAWLKFEKYYQLTEQAPVYVAGILLHPALRKNYLSEQWKRNPAWVSNAVKVVRKIWSTEYKSYQLPDKQQENGQELDEFDRWRRKVYSTASEVKDEFDRFIHVSNWKHSNGRILTILRRAHRSELVNKRPYSGGLNRPSKRISPSSPAWLLTYSVFHQCPRNQSGSSRAQDGKLHGIEAACLRKWWRHVSALKVG